MEKIKKDLIIDSMIELLNIARELPFFSVVFTIAAYAKDIEQYIVDHVDRYDWEGRPLDGETVEKMKKEKLENFHNSSGYSETGKSLYPFNKTFTINDITFDNLKQIICGEDERLPKGYEFYSGFFLVNDLMKKEAELNERWNNNKVD